MYIKDPYDSDSKITLLIEVKMRIREFFELYREPECEANLVWEFNIDKNYCIADKQDLFDNYPELLDKEMTDFTITIDNQIDYENDIVNGLKGLKIYPKTKVFIYTTDWKDTDRKDWKD